jgi:hypothetical protein
MCACSSEGKQRVRKNAERTNARTGDGLQRCGDVNGVQKLYKYIFSLEKKLKLNKIK